MKKELRLPFQSLPHSAWTNLIFAIILCLYIFILGFHLVNNKICGTIGFDYCAYWSGGRIINESGYAGLYDLDKLRQYQKEIFPQAELLLKEFIPVELPYLPIFMIPFQLLSLLEVKTSYLFWTLVNIIGYFFYLRYFIEKVVGKNNSNKIILMVLLSYPVFLNIYFGQLNIWLGICAGEFIRAYLSSKPEKAGFWLAGWLLKPQLLLIIIPYIFFQRSYKVLKGFFIASVIILSISLGLIRFDGLLKLINMVRASAQGAGNSNPIVMMNWRMLGSHITSLSSSTIGWLVVIIGTIITVVAAIIYFKRFNDSDPDRFVVIFFGLSAVTCAVAWHAHLHTSIILIPPLLYLYLKKFLIEKKFNIWIFMPILAQILIYFLMLNSIIGKLPDKYYQIIYFLEGVRGLVLNLLLLIWSIAWIKNYDKEKVYLNIAIINK